MTRRICFRILAAAMTFGSASAASASAQTRSVQPVQQAAIAQQSDRAPTPDRPVQSVVLWDEVRSDAREEAARRQPARTVAVAQQTQAFPRPRNLRPGDLDGMEVPVLVPTYRGLGFSGEPDVMIFPRGDFYTLVAMGEGVTIEVFCTRLAHSEPVNAQTARRLVGSGPEGYRSERTEYGREVSFNRYGVAYSITVECADPMRDPRCTAPEYGDRLMQSLQVLPGSRGTQGAQ